MSVVMPMTRLSSVTRSVGRSIVISVNDYFSFRSTAAGTLDPWHLAQKFTSLPTLNSTFIQEDPPLSRVLAVGSSANGQQLICDTFFDIISARPLPMYSVPGLIDHF